MVTTTPTDLQEPFARERDDAHPVRWSPADGDTPAYLTLKGAAERLARYFGGDPADYEADLLCGGPTRTPFAFYQIDDPIDPNGPDGYDPTLGGEANR